MIHFSIVALAIGMSTYSFAQDSNYFVDCKLAHSLGTVTIDGNWGWVDTSQTGGFSCRDHSGIAGEEYPICYSQSTEQPGNTIHYESGDWGWVEGNGFSCRTASKGLFNELNSSIMLMGEWDYGRFGRAEQMLDVTLNHYSNGALNFVPTHYFLPFSEEEADSYRFCHSRINSWCPNFDRSSVDDFQDGMRRWFQLTVEGEADIVITPHLDDGHNNGAWRNRMKFDPYPIHGEDCSDIGKYQTYFCTMLAPIARALNESIAPGTKVYFAMQGEMGATIFAYPESYRRLIPVLKSMILSQRSDLDPHDIQIGISLNYNFIDGGSHTNQAMLRLLFESVDFIGISGYGSVGAYPKARDFNSSANSFAAELKQNHGIDLKSLLKNHAIELHYSEFGLGGGNGLGEKAKTREDAAHHLWSGIHGNYRPENDPFIAGDLRTFQEEFYCQALVFFSGQSKDWPISAAFLWNLTSWDVQGIYPNSTNDNGGYHRMLISEWISEYNYSHEVGCPRGDG